MRNFTLEQKILFFVCLIVIIGTAYQVVSINYRSSINDIRNKYTDNLNDIEKLESSLQGFSNFSYKFKDDLFFLKKNIAVKPVANKPVIKGKVSWKYNGRIEYYKGNNLSIVLISGSKVKLMTKGKMKEYTVGSRIAVGRQILDKYYNGKHLSGETKLGRDHKEKIILITDREVYFSLPNSKALKMTTRNKRTIIPRSKVSSSGSSSGGNDRRTIRTGGRGGRGGRG